MKWQNTEKAPWQPRPCETQGPTAQRNGYCETLAGRQTSPKQAVAVCSEIQLTKHHYSRL